ISRQIRPDSSEVDRSFGAKFLAKILSHSSPQQGAIEAYINHLTGGSLQSTESLYEVVGALGLWPDDVGLDRKVFDPIFDVRNKIIHELDVNLDAERRTRNVRRRDAMVAHTNQLLLLAHNILKKVDSKIGVSP